MGWECPIIFIFHHSFGFSAIFFTFQSGQMQFLLKSPWMKINLLIRSFSFRTRQLSLLLARFPNLTKGPIYFLNLHIRGFRGVNNWNDDFLPPNYLIKGECVCPAPNPITCWWGCLTSPFRIYKSFWYSLQFLCNSLIRFLHLPYRRTKCPCARIL